MNTNSSFTHAAYVEDPTPINEEQKLVLTRWRQVAVAWVLAHVPIVSAERAAFIKCRISNSLKKIDATKTVSEYHHCVRVLAQTTFLMNQFIHKLNENARLPLYLPAFQD